MIDHPRVLILTLYSGENEFDACVESIRQQTYSNNKHVVIGGLGNLEAHRACYSKIMSSRDEFDLFLKLDADMVFRSKTKLEEMVGVFLANSGMDHVVFSVRDWLADMELIGAHMFSSRARWVFDSETLFVDPDPMIPGKKLKIIRREPAPVAWHNGDPSCFQSFHFGVHRALKVVQPGRPLLIQRSLEQWYLLYRIWRGFSKTSDRKKGLAVMGADAVLQGTVKPSTYDYTDDSLRLQYNELVESVGEDIHGFLSPRWESFIKRERLHLSSLLKTRRRGWR